MRSGPVMTGIDRRLRRMLRRVGAGQDDIVDDGNRMARGNFELSLLRRSEKLMPRLRDLAARLVA